VRPTNHWKACNDRYKSLYRTQQDGHLFAIGSCRVARGDVTNRD
jgi:hypothetical protein